MWTKIMESSNFTAVFRDNLLFVKFKSWAWNVYVYLDVSDDDKNTMDIVASKWKFLHSDIKPKYKFEKTKFTDLTIAFNEYE